MTELRLMTPAIERSNVLVSSGATRPTATMALVDMSMLSTDLCVVQLIHSSGIQIQKAANPIT
ncbi:unannotated protein [freshwater metagenome]|uniref:Unannotated protein n=1 Tax=freshwater metagenome TaxID=449393 RepID=A0A6J7EMZ4_9ZZZZ